MSAGFHMYLFMNEFLSGCVFAVVVIQWCFMIGVNVWWVYLAPQNIPSANWIETCQYIFIVFVENSPKCEYLNTYKLNRNANLTKQNVSLGIERTTTEVGNEFETRMTTIVLKQDSNRWKVQKNAIY